MRLINYFLVAFSVKFSVAKCVLDLFFKHKGETVCKKGSI